MEATNGSAAADPPAPTSEKKKKKKKKEAESVSAADSTLETAMDTSKWECDFVFTAHFYPALWIAQHADWPIDGLSERDLTFSTLAKAKWAPKM